MSDWDRQTTPGASEGPQWVSAAEAADVAGVTPGTVRYWARNGLIVSEVVQGPAGEKTLVRLDEVLQHARQDNGGGGVPAEAGGRPAPVTDLPARTSELAPILKSIPEIMAQLTAATDRAARAETKVEFLSAQLADARRRLAEAEAGRASGPSVAPVPEAWEAPTRAGEPPGVATPEAPGSEGWPAPPTDAAPAATDLGAAAGDPAPATDEAEPGPESIDWTSGDPDAVVQPPGAEPEGPPKGSDSLEELWAQPTRTEAAPEAPPPAPGSEAVQWHDPAWPPQPAEEVAEPEPEPEAEPTAPRRANATIPEEGFYGPRRRRWFKRRR